MDKKKNKPTKKKQKKISYLEGKKIYLRPFLKNDLTYSYLRWVNNYERSSFMEAGKFPLNETDLKKYYEINNNSHNSFLFAICNKKNQHVGNALISNIDWVNRRCNYGRLIGETKKIQRGAGTECLKLLQDFVFNKLNLNLMWTSVCTKNFASMKSNINVGMKIGGKINQFFYRNNKYYQVTFFYMTRSDYIQNK